MVTFVYFVLVQRNVPNKRTVLLGDTNPLCPCNGKKDADDAIYRNKVTVEMTGKINKNSAENVWLHYSTATQIEKD